MQDKICPLLLASKKQGDSEEHVFCRKEDCAWWFFKPYTATGAEISGSCSILKIAEFLR
jgi:hypothetical protein